MAWLFLKNKEFSISDKQTFIENLRHYSIEADFNENYLISSKVREKGHRKYIGRIGEDVFKLEKIVRWNELIFINPGLAFHRLIVQPLKIQGEFTGLNKVRLSVYRSPWLYLSLCLTYFLCTYGFLYLLGGLQEFTFKNYFWLFAPVYFLVIDFFYTQIRGRFLIKEILKLDEK